MDKINEYSDIVKERFEKFSCSPPLLFSIPRNYEDDNERDKDSYTKLQQLERTVEKLKGSFAEIAQRHATNFERTREMINTSLAINNKFVYRFHSIKRRTNIE